MNLKTCAEKTAALSKTPLELEGGYFVTTLIKVSYSRFLRSIGNRFVHLESSLLPAKTPEIVITEQISDLLVCHAGIPVNAVRMADS